MSKLDELAKAILNSETDKNTTAPYDTTATVVRVDGNTAYVHIPDGVEETPALMAVSAKAGDSVRLRVSGGKAYVTGNATAPPTDDSYAKKAEAQALRATKAADYAVQEAETAHKAAGDAQRDASAAHVSATNAEADARKAKEAAEEAVDDAARAEEAANSAATSAFNAEASASNAETYARNASTSAAEAAISAGEAASDAAAAKISARDANEYATRALSGLSTVQSVSETLAWVTQHGTMTLTADTEIDLSHVYFVQDNNGDYVVNNVHYSLVIEPDVADISTYYELSIDESLNNYVGTHLSLTSEGLWLLPATSGTHKVLIATGAGTTYTTPGTYIINSNGGADASFRSDGATIGDVLQTHLSLGSDAIQGYTSNGQCLLDTRLSGAMLPVKIVVNFGAKYTYELGPRETMSKAITEIDVLTTGMSFQLSIKVTLGYSTFDFVYGTASSAAYGAVVYDGTNVISLTNNLSSSATQIVGAFMYTVPDDAPMWTFGGRKEGSANGGYSYAEGSGVEASGDYSHAEGYATIASGDKSHAEGSQTEASGDYSHAEGDRSEASGDYSHAEGSLTEASGEASHAEGDGTVASGAYSHAQNYGTIASSNYQTVLGKLNVEDANSTYSVIVGNGVNSSERKNSAALEVGGTLRLKGDVCVGCADDSTGGTLLKALMDTTTSNLTSLSHYTAGFRTYNDVLSVNWSDCSYTGIGNEIKSIVGNMTGYTLRWVSIRVNNTGASVDPFGTSSFSVLFNCSSTNYGWCILNSDSSRSGFIVGRLSSGTWIWKNVWGDLDALNSKTTGTISKYSGVSGGTLDSMGLTKVGDTVFGSARLYSVSATANGSFFEIPAGFRPTNIMRVMGYIYVNNIAIPAHLFVNPNGIISISYSSSQTLTQIGFAGSWTVK